MDWISQHLQIILAAAGAVAWWLNQRKAGKPEESAAPAPEKSFVDPELAERTRRIREEIQRKIEQRMRGYTPPAAAPRPEPAAPPVMREVVVKTPETATRTRAAATQLEEDRTAGILAEQAALMTRLSQAQALTSAAQRRSQYETEAAGKEELAKGEVRSALADDLRDPAALRRAFILREILGPPVALRG
jgi:hypothetical protein